jgi:hypothetical protein
MKASFAHFFMVFRSMVNDRNRITEEDENTVEINLS